MAYFGSKRKLCRHIFKHLDRPSMKEIVFIDAFMGGGSVSLYAKQIGYKVVSGDISLRGNIEINNPYPLVNRIIKQINETIFNNGRQCVFKQGSAFDLIQEWKDKADVLYMDPPYPGTLSYDESMWIDKSIVQDIEYKEEFGDEWTDKNKFTATYDKYMEESKNIPNLIMSIGNWDPNELLSIMRKYRPKAQLFSIKHNWLRSLAKKDKGDELMLIDLKKWY